MATTPLPSITAAPRNRIIPGVDRQYSTGLSVALDLHGLGAATLTTIATYADSKVDYSFDGDWGNPHLWAPYTYDFTDYQMRHRSTRSLELRLSDTPARRRLGHLLAVRRVCLRAARIAVGHQCRNAIVDPFDASQNSDTLTVIASRYRSRNAAVYAQLDGDFDRRCASLGMRAERHTSSYDDTTTILERADGGEHLWPADNFWGGQASLDFAIAEGQHVYALAVARLQGRRI